MIYNDRQQKVTITKLEELKDASTATKVRNDIDNFTKSRHLATIEGMINDLNIELSGYTLLKSGNYNYVSHTSLDYLPNALVSARISQGLSQSALAVKAGLKPQQIQRYEANNYMSASLSRLIELSQILNLKITERLGQLEHDIHGTIYSWTTHDDIEWSRFPFKEMLKRGWLGLESKSSPFDAVKEYFLKTAGANYATALHRKKFYGENAPNEFSLLAWQARIIEKANHVIHRGDINEFYLRDSWLPELLELSRKENAPLLAQQHLATKGIILVFEPHLAQTYLDGAAMLSNSGNPIIGMTLRHDRLDNFWFVLFHELGHVFLHLFDNLGLDFFDENDGVSNDPIEQEADQFATEALIPSDLWDQCLSRFSQSEESVKLDALNLGIHESIIAGRIRKESNDYRILNNLIGSGKVRHLFLE